MSLKDRLIRQIRMDGPIPVSAYMQTCLHDPKDGYYANGAGIGRDFITAPETSQMFGELLGLWIAAEWRALGEPAGFNLVEMGPGRGTLLADALRTANHLPGFKAAAKLHLIEASPALRAVQASKLNNWAPQFCDHPDALPSGPMLLIANEFLDCLPARQFVRETDHWRERLVGLDETGTGLAFGVDRSDVPDAAAAALGAVEFNQEAELQPGLTGLVETLQTRTEAGAPFRGLLIDYGPDTQTPGDTLRAYKEGKQVDPLACPGEADLTVDVDFARLSRLASQTGLSVSGPTTQSAFLARLGLQARLDTLVKANPKHAKALFTGAQKLVDPNEMGTRFKAICLSSVGLPSPAGFS